MSRRSLDVHTGPRYSADVVPEDEAQEIIAEDAEYKDAIVTRPVDDDDSDSAA